MTKSESIKSSSIKNEDELSKYNHKLKIKKEKRLNSPNEDNLDQESESEFEQVKKKLKTKTNKNHKSIGKSWKSEEDWKLFQILHPKINKPDWNNISSLIGNERDSKSCQNRYSIISKRLEGAIKSIGGS
ncbi:uncharacterized protein I206_101527 [Kwoniella pini CBS 10737]|uniref:Myb-like domain-containing protein n=1 Tax=Kwoniella pini CBS 10737 TaxID=1296096 RepID=A0A1B9HWE5_9TREE|nr:uncharacterized protein I206_06500 [Kwoniella pini CBS 10737]OCF47597.1 hypothetical protein I206_06500 [Kwoniella pini CBS 10737]